MAEGGWKQHDAREKNVEAVDVKYFEFLMNGRCPWDYDDKYKTIQAYSSGDGGWKILDEVFDHFRNRCSTEIPVDCDLTTVESFFDRTDIKERYPFAFPIIKADRNVCCLTLFSSVEDDLQKIRGQLEGFLLTRQRPWRRRQHSVYSDDYDGYFRTPGEKLGTFYLTAQHRMCVLAGDIFDYDGTDVGIVNPVVIRKSGQIEGKGILFESIKETGGYTYRDSLSRYSSVEPTSRSCIVTSCGRLRAKIIHPTRPLTNDKSTRQNNIFMNMFDCLTAARSNKLKRLIFPFVYSGSGNVDLKECAYHYACALTEFFRLYPTPLIGPYENLFVEIDKAKARSLVPELRCFLATQSTELMKVPRFTVSRSTEVLAEYVCKNTTVAVQLGNIVEAHADVIVCPEYTQTEYRSYVSNVIKFAFRIDQNEIDEKVRKGKVASSRCSLHPKCERNIFVYHTEAVTFKTGSFATKEASKKGIRIAVERVFEKLKRHKKRNIKSIAIPLIGVTDVSDTTTVRKVCKVFLKAVLSCCSVRTDGPLLHVQLINHCQQITDWLQEYLYSEVNAP